MLDNSLIEPYRCEATLIDDLYSESVLVCRIEDLEKDAPRPLQGECIFLLEFAEDRFYVIRVKMEKVASMFSCTPLELHERIKMESRRHSILIRTEPLAAAYLLN